VNARLKLEKLPILLY